MTTLTPAPSANAEAIAALDRPLHEDSRIGRNRAPRTRDGVRTGRVHRAMDVGGVHHKGWHVRYVINPDDVCLVGKAKPGRIAKRNQLKGQSATCNPTRSRSGRTSSYSPPAQRIGRVLQEPARDNRDPPERGSVDLPAYQDTYHHSLMTTEGVTK